MQDCFFSRSEDVFHSNEHCRGPWHKDFQHAGPPSALIARQIEEQADGMHVARIHIDLLKPIPIKPLQIKVEQAVAGKRRRVLLAYVYEEGQTQCIAQANALLLRKESIATGPLPLHQPDTPTPPEQCQDAGFNFFPDAPSYARAMHTKCTGIEQQGRGQMWMKPRIDLVDNEPASALQRIFLAADSGSGVSMALDPKRYSFLNSDLNISIHRPAASDWVCLDARTHFQSDGHGLCETLVWDEHGVVASATQNLLLQRLV